MLETVDIDLLSDALRTHPDLQYDVDGNGSVDDSDLTAWLHDLKQTYLGDPNLDGEFASSDLVNVFAAGEYEDDIDLNSTWGTGA